MIDKAKEVISYLLANPVCLSTLRENPSSVLRLLGGGEGQVDVIHTAKRLLDTLASRSGRLGASNPSGVNHALVCRRTQDSTLGAVAAVGLTGLMGAIATLGLVGVVALCHDDADSE